ncbi:hydroxyethylthiazole kinase [Thioclava sp. DLFJ4-1]|uniref:hydroxyethylthiazole kinase n=1 Tax=Thioclava sp. DLFJ4-1 TaxID=1915313 RepID=UPI000996D778|nr:hydroxyethylthiazole kinase [Thioclava sp. DLFJ4-1]OOY17458.1 hydroxyethylthiazole kinase [Thioclava sp. DLFJ4-1]
MEDPGQYLATMRQTAPLVHNITNYVAMNVMANVLLASGASPAMVHAREEAAEFAGIAQALSINIGTVSPPWAEAMEAAATVARAKDIPWVLDPVAVGATGYRRALGARLVELRPTVIRGNASEILALAGEAGAGKGADATESVATAEGAARALARHSGAVVAVTGAVDFVTDGERAARVANGHAMMPRVTALGCSLTGVVAAFLAGQPRFEAVIAALAYFGLAGERAGATAQGPGSFQVAFLDALHAIDADTLTAGARIEPA